MISALFATGTSGLGIVSVTGRRRVPWPAARITAFIEGNSSRSTYHHAAHGRTDCANSTAYVQPYQAIKRPGAADDQSFVQYTQNQEKTPRFWGVSVTGFGHPN